MCRLFGPIPLTSVAILVPADIHRHVHRFAPFLGLIGAGGSSAHRACEQYAVLKLGCDVYLVQLRGRGRCNLRRGLACRARLDLGMRVWLDERLDESHCCLLLPVLLLLLTDPENFLHKMLHRDLLRWLRVHM